MPFGTQFTAILIIPVYEAERQPRVRIEPDCLGLKLHSATDELCDLGQVLGLPVCKLEAIVIIEPQYLLTELAFEQVTFCKAPKQRFDS